MSNFKETVKKAVGNSAIFNKTADFLSEKQKKFKAEQALDNAKTKLDELYLELGKTSYKKRPLTEGRTQAVIREEIAVAIVEVDTLQQALDDLNSSSKNESEETTESTDNNKAE